MEVRDRGEKWAEEKERGARGVEEARVTGEREQRRLAIKDREKEWMSERVERKGGDRGVRRVLGIEEGRSEVKEGGW